MDNADFCTVDVAQETWINYSQYLYANNVRRESEYWIHQLFEEQVMITKQKSYRYTACVSRNNRVNRELSLKDVTTNDGYTDYEWNFVFTVL